MDNIFDKVIFFGRWGIVIIIATPILIFQFLWFIIIQPLHINKKTYKNAKKKFDYFFDNIFY